MKSIPKAINDSPSTSSSAGLSKSGGFSITKNLVQSLKNFSPATPKDDKEENQMDSHNNIDSSSVEDSIKPKYDWGSGSGHSMKPILAAEHIEEIECDEMETEPDVNFVRNFNCITFLKFFYIISYSRLENGVQ